MKNWIVLVLVFVFSLSQVGLAQNTDKKKSNTAGHKTRIQGILDANAVARDGRKLMAERVVERVWSGRAREMEESARGEHVLNRNPDREAPLFAYHEIAGKLYGVTETRVKVISRGGTFLFDRATLDTKSADFVNDSEKRMEAYHKAAKKIMKDQRNKENYDKVR